MMSKDRHDQVPANFVNVRDHIPSLPIDLRYATERNFIGRRIIGYEQACCFLTRDAADALNKVQTCLLSQDYSLLLFDAYRPQRAVNDFIQWAYDARDEKMKDQFYPQVDKPDLLEQGFIAKRSTHSRGSTVDLTIASAEIVRVLELEPCHWESQYSLDMGTHFDLFDERSFTLSAKINREQQRNRKFLLDIMEQHGFENFPMEWWHFTYRPEPYPDTYFDFVPY